MTTKESLNKVIEYKKGKGCGNPVFILMMFEHPDKELVYPTGKHSGFPDLGSTRDVGFFHNLDVAILSMNENNADIRECVYDAGFILCHFPGVYQEAGPNERMYFVWDEKRQGFFQREEPGLFAKCAF